MTDFTKPLDDNRLEAARAICDAVFEPDGVVFCTGEENFEIPPRNELNALQTARRVTLADELAAHVLHLLALLGAESPSSAPGRELAATHELLARYKEISG